MTMVARERAIDKLRRLMDARTNTTNGVSLSVKEIGPNQFDLSFYTAIQSNVTYLFIVTLNDADSPALLIVKGSDLYTAAVEAGDESGNEDWSLQAGIKAYLKKYGSIDGVEEISIEVHKLDRTNPLESLTYNTTTGETVFQEADPVATSGYVTLHRDECGCSYSRDHGEG